jgi:hypothetical protein
MLKTFTQIFGTAFNETYEREAARKALDFTNKDQYLAWLKAWKADLAEINQEIRACKGKRKKCLWEVIKTIMGERAQTTKKNIGINPDYDSWAAIERQNLRDRARNLMFLRFFAKEMAHEQREAARLGAAAE